MSFLPSTLSSPESTLNKYLRYMGPFFNPNSPQISLINPSAPEHGLLATSPLHTVLQAIISDWSELTQGIRPVCYPGATAMGSFFQWTTENTRFSASSQCSPPWILYHLFPSKAQWDDGSLKGTVNGTGSHLLLCFFVCGPDTRIELSINTVVSMLLQVD